MKQFLKWLGKHIAGALVFSLFSILFIAGIVYSLTYPSTPPAGEVAGGKFQANFNKIFGALEFTGGTVQIVRMATENGICSGNGLIARDNNGLILSCQGGTWRKATGGGGNPSVTAASINAISTSWVLWDGVGEKCSQTISGLNGFQSPGDNESWVSNAKVCVRISGSQVQVRLTHGTACIGWSSPAYDSGWVNGTFINSTRLCYGKIAAYGWIQGVSALYKYYYDGGDNGNAVTKYLYNQSSVQY